MKEYLLLSIFGVVTIFTTSNRLQEVTTHTRVADSLELDRKKHIEAVLKSVGGNRKAIADSVFKDIQLFKGAPVGRLLAVMEIGYSKSLGVSCGHCHDVNAFEKNDKKQKRIARDMYWMTKKLNAEVLKGIKDISADATVNCTTCHRGKVKPALDL